MGTTCACLCRSSSDTAGAEPETSKRSRAVGSLPVASHNRNIEPSFVVVFRADALRCHTLC